MRRRGFLIGGASALLLGSGAVWLQRGAPWRGAETASAVRARLRLGDGAYAAIRALQGTDPIAGAAMAAMQGVADPAIAIENSLIERLGLARELDIAAPAFDRRLAAAIGEDFRQARLCAGSDWVLSQTECEVAALRLMVFGAQPSVTNEEGYAQGQIAEIIDWGQRETQQDTPFNVQGDGHSGIWIKTRGAPPWVRFEIGGERVGTVHTGDLITTGLYGDLQGRILSTPGAYEVALVDEMARIRQPFGVFTVRPRAARLVRADGSVSKVFCPVQGWGPSAAVAGQPANPQPNGNEAFWIQTACAPPSVRAFLGETELRTTVSLDLVTASVPRSRIARPGEWMLELRDRESGEVLQVGRYAVVAGPAAPVAEAAH
ncbi:hypothetical protein [Dokdonella sp.]|uniref:hypothetical protein n=1 Tax=Dokdonella sp. TaxID=2291710 RepID=UPI0031CB2246|nr:hypothetical protein [Dokdonella sp.]